MGAIAGVRHSLSLSPEVELLADESRTRRRVLSPTKVSPTGIAAGLALLEWPIDDDPTDGAERMRQWRQQQLAKSKATFTAIDRGSAAHGPVAEFVSNANAVEMSPADIANVEPLRVSAETAELIDKLTPQDAGEILATIGDELFKSADHDESWGGWHDDDGRWELTPHELRKLRNAVC